MRVDSRFLDDLLEQGVDQEIQLSVFEPALEALCKRCSDGEGNHNIVGVLGGAEMVSNWHVEWMTSGGIPYIADNPEEPGVRCLRMELSLSPAILKLC